MLVTQSSLASFLVSGGDHPTLPGKQYLFRFPNDYGASVIHAPPFSYGVELAVIQWNGADWELCYATPIADDVIGHIANLSELEKLLFQIKNLPAAVLELEKETK
jgi:hypothetical protein